MAHEAIALWTETSSDPELIAGVRAGDGTAFGVLYERHVDAARKVAAQYTNTAADVDDVVAESFSRVLRALQRGDGPDLAFRAYLFTIVRRTGMDTINRGNRTRPGDDMSHYESALGYEAPSDEGTLVGFEQGVVAEAFRSLPERWQAVLWYTEVEKKSPKEIAPLLGLTANGVAALAYRAREALRQAYLQQHLNTAESLDCLAAATQLGAYVRGGLAKREHAKVDDHVRNCEKCAALVAELEDVNRGMRGIIAPLVLGVLGMGALEGGLPIGGIFGAGEAAGAAGGASATGGAAGGGSMSGLGAASTGFAGWVGAAAPIVLPAAAGLGIVALVVSGASYLGVFNPLERSLGLTPDVTTSPDPTSPASPQPGGSSSAGPSESPSATPSPVPSATPTAEDELEPAPAPVPAAIPQGQLGTGGGTGGGDGGTGGGDGGTGGGDGGTGGGDGGGDGGTGGGDGGGDGGTGGGDGGTGGGDGGTGGGDGGTGGGDGGTGGGDGGTGGGDGGTGGGDGGTGGGDGGTGGGDGGGGTTPPKVAALAFGEAPLGQFEVSRADPKVSLSLANSGEGDAEDVAITITLPDGLGFAPPSGGASPSGLAPAERIGAFLSFANSNTITVDDWTCTVDEARVSASCETDVVGAGEDATLTLALAPITSATFLDPDAFTQFDASAGDVSATYRVRTTVADNDENLSGAYAKTGRLAASQVGSTVMGCDLTQDACRSVMAFTGTDSRGDLNNNAQSMRALNTAGGALNSGSTVLSEQFLPAGATVKYALLEWSANKSSADRSWTGATDSARLKTPGGSYKTITADTVEWTNRDSRQYYVARADVTALVAAARNGTYSVADIALSAGAEDTDRTYYGGFTLTVVYEHESLPISRVAVFAGSQWMAASSSADFTFYAGDKSTVKIGWTAWEADRGNHGDMVRLDGDNFVPIRWPGTDPDQLGNSGNAADSTAFGSEFANTLGVDAKSFKPKEVDRGLHTILISTNGDQFLIGSLTITQTVGD